MASVEPAAGPERRRSDLRRWRRRSRFVAALRIVLPVLIGAILAVLLGIIAYRTFTGPPAEPQEANAPIRLVNPRFVGRDEQGRSFVLTAASAVRDDQDYQRVLLDRPSLVIDEEGQSPTRLTAGSGVLHEGEGKLQLFGGVRLSDPQQAFETATSEFDTATGELSGAGPIEGVGSLGEIRAKSYGVYDKGERMVFKGGVSARIQTE